MADAAVSFCHGRAAVVCTLDSIGAGISFLPICGHPLQLLLLFVWARCQVLLERQSARERSEHTARWCVPVSYPACTLWWSLDDACIRRVGEGVAVAAGRSWRRECWPALAAARATRTVCSSVIGLPAECARLRPHHIDGDVELQREMDAMHLTNTAVQTYQL